MKIRFTISLKLLMLILPLVCLPIAIVGYFSYDASVQRVDRLVKQEQMVKVRASAGEINDILYYCRLDLETIAGLPVLQDYHAARSFRLNAEAEFNYDNIVRLFKDFVRRTPFYYQIRYIDETGMERIKVRRDGEVNEFINQDREKFFREIQRMRPKEIYVSRILKPAFRDELIMHWAKPIYSAWRQFAGTAVIDLDYDRIIEIVNKIHVGERGYAFLVDQHGRSIAHPRFKPYEIDLNSSPESSLKDLVQLMMSGASDHKPYKFEGEEKVAAFAPIPILGWSLAVTIPTDEFRKEARAIQARVFEVVVAALIFTVICVGIISYYILRPIRNLVTATNRVASGDLNHEIPIHSRDELGELTHSFNRMTKNLSKIQNELVRSEKLISLGRLSAGVAHEIRNPLNAIKGAIVYLKRKRSDDPLLQEYTQLVSEEIDRLNTVVTEFLYFARQSKPKAVPTDLNKLIRSARNLLDKQAREMGVRFHDKLDDNLPPAVVDPHQIEQVLVNILINALDAVPQGGDISITTQSLNDGAASGFIRIEILDNGVGIADQYLQNIFDPFFSTKEGGTGLGLPLSLGIVENHGGKMTVVTLEGTGTRFVIDLPLGAAGVKEEILFEQKNNIDD